MQIILQKPKQHSSTWQLGGRLLSDNSCCSPEKSPAICAIWHFPREHVRESSSPPRLYFLCNLCFTDIDLFAVTTSEDLTNKLLNSASTHGMEISTDKSKVTVNNMTVNQRCTWMEYSSRRKKVLSAVSKDGTCTADISIKIPALTASMTKLNRM